MTFTPEDVKHLANLCHNCAECYYACQYAPPHEFAVNVPQVFAQVRLQSYEEYSWPKGAWRSLQGWGLLAVCLIAVAVVAGAGLYSSGGQGFYAVVSHEAMVAMFSSVAVFAALVLLIGARRALGSGSVGWGSWTGLKDALTLKNMSSGGKGCTYPNERHSNARRWLHHATFYGFALCFASTTVAAAYHYLLGLEGPHPYLSAPVVLGTLGGIGLLVGPLGLALLKRRRDTAIADAAQHEMDAGFLVSLFVTSFTGLLLMILRGTSWMGPLLNLHLVVVLVLFLTMPYGKFVHGLYRTIALIRNASER